MPTNREQLLQQLPNESKLARLEREALERQQKNAQLANQPNQALRDEAYQTYQFGFRIPFLPDFLLDHTLLEKEPHERIAEHCRRWTQFVAGLWREEGVTYALVYDWFPASTNSTNSDESRVGSIEITLLGSVEKNKVQEDLAPDLACALEAFGFSPQALSGEEINHLMSVPDSEIFEVRQRDDRVQVDAEAIRRNYAGELSAEKLEIIKRGVYTVSPWWGAGGANLVPFQTLVAQTQPVSIWVLLRPISLNAIAHERAWFMEWTRLLAKWAEDSGSTGESITLSESSAQMQQTSIAQGTQQGYSEGSSFSEGDNYFFAGNWQRGSNQQHSSGASQMNTDTAGQTDTKGVSVTKGNASFTRKDPQARWIAEEATAFFRKLNNPFYATVYCISKNTSAGRLVANSIASTISEETPFEPPIGETSPRRSNAQLIVLNHKQKQSALQACRTLKLDPQQIQSSSNLLMQEPKSLNYIVDARAAATVFRFPVNVRGGIPGIEIKQQAPDFHPGAIHPTAPKGSIEFGKLRNLGVAFIEPSAFKKHALITGFTGSGKTVTVLNLLHQFWIDCGIPFLVIESAKQEYRGLMRVDGFRGSLRIYTLGNEVCAPFRLNPFELLPGVRVEAHISKLQTCFEGALPPIGPLASLIYEALLLVYRQKGWQLTDIYPTDGSKVWRSFPTMTDFAQQVETLITLRGYQGEVRDNLTAAIAGRIKPLTLGSKGRMFDTQRSSPTAKELFSIPTILELNDLNQEDKALVVMFLLTLLREYREIDPSLSGELKHITVVEEAHNVLENVQSTGTAEGSSSNTRYKAVQAFCNLLAEIRALGEGLIIADQSPEKLAPDALRNTNVQIAHQLRDSRDREAIAKAMIMDDEQCDFLGKLEPGHAALFVTGLQKATFIQVPKYYPTAEDIKLKYGEDSQTGEVRLRNEFRGYGFAAVSDNDLKKYMNPLTQKHRRLDLPFAGCLQCKAEGCYRDAMFTLAQEQNLNSRFKQVYQLSKPEIREQQEKTVEDFWDAVILLSENAAMMTDATSNVDAAWCFFVHAWDKEFRQQFPDINPESVPLTEIHRAPFERHYSKLQQSLK